MSGYILLMALIILICLLLKKVSSKFGIPVLLAFIVLGMIFGSDGVFKIYFDDYKIAEQVCSIALIFIMFYGGFGTNWSCAKPVVTKAVLLSTVGVVMTAGITGLFCYFILHIDFWESMLIGAVISSTDAASVFAILRSKRINLRDGTAPMLEVESGSNDPCSYMLTVIVISIMTGGGSGWKLVGMVVTQILFGILIGVGTAMVASYVISRMKPASEGADTVFVFSMALVSYAGATILGGNGYLSTYITGIMLGNRSYHNKKALVHFFDGITTLMQMLIFFLLGLLSFPSELPKVMIPALAIMVFLTFIARPVAIYTILRPFGCSRNQMLLVSWTGIRGAASIVFAIMAIVAPITLTQDIFHIVFFIVLFSISIQGTLIPFLSKKLDMIDDNSNIMKTFNDYSEEMPLQFLQLDISKKHPWCGKKIRDIVLLPEVLLVLILRGEERLIPNGDTMIHEGDVAVLSAFSLEHELGGVLTEIVIEQDSDWLGNTLEEIELGEEKLIVTIKRGTQIVIPNGKTVIREKDILVVSQL